MEQSEDNRQDQKSADRDTVDVSVSRTRAARRARTQSFSRSRPLRILSAVTILLVGSNLTLCSANTSNIDVSGTAKEAAQVPLLHTNPPSRGQLGQSQLPGFLNRLEPSLHPWKLKELQTTAANANAKTGTKNRLPQRMNVRRRHHKSARVKQINRALKHHSRNQHQHNHNADGHHHHNHMHTISPQVLEAHLEVMETTSPAEVDDTESEAEHDDYYTLMEAASGLKGAKKAGAKVADSMNHTDADRHAPKDKYAKVHVHKAAKTKEHKVGKVSKGKEAKKYKAHKQYDVPLTNEQIDEEYLHVHMTDEQIDEHYLHIHSDAGKTSKGKYSSKGSSSKAKRVKKGKKGHRGKSSKRGPDLGVRYFEANVLLEMRDHYVAPLSYMDLEQLENSVLETYNHLSNQNCDLQGRQLIAVTADPTPTSTGYILHLQGECYNCDPTNVRVFAHPDEIFDDNMMMIEMGPMEPEMPDSTRPPIDDDMTMETPDTPGGNGTASDGGTTTDPGDTAGTGGGTTQVGNATGGAGMDTPSGDNSTMMMPAGELPAPETNTTGRNRGAGSSTSGGSGGGSKFDSGGYYYSGGGSSSSSSSSSTATTYATAKEDVPYQRKPKKVRTASKERSRLERPSDYNSGPQHVEEEEPSEFDFGISAQSRARYHHNEGVRKLNHNHHHHAVNRNPESVDVEHQHGVNVNRDPMPMEPEDTNRAFFGGSDSTMISVKKSKSRSVKGYKETESKGKKGKKNGSKGYHPIESCNNDDAPRRAPTEEEFVEGLNHVTDNLLAQYNKISVRTALQVRPLSCDATEESFGSGIVVLFMGPGSTDAGLSPEEIMLMERTILQSYNHLQATHSCDVPYFREMTDLVLKGIAPGPAEGTFLAMFESHGTCRGKECSDGATFFDPLDESSSSGDGDDDDSRRHLRHHIPETGFNPVLSPSGHEIGYDGGDAHVYQEQCYCPLKVDEFGPPFVSDLQDVLNSVLKDACNTGLVETMVTVLDIMEMPSDNSSEKTTDDDVAYEKTLSPGPARGTTEQFESFVIVQFFGQRDLVTESEVNAIEDSMPVIFQDLQDNDFCDSVSRVLTSSVLQTVDPGPTDDSFLLGFFWVGTCEGQGCSNKPMFFASPGEAMIGCGMGKVLGPPVIEDFENNLFSAILSLRDDGSVVNIQANGDAVEAPPGSTPAPILSSEEATAAPTSTPTTAAMFQRSQMIKARNARTKPPAQPRPTNAPTNWPTWLDTDYPTYLVV
ncbi:expressed unknown protein [Seminavis robusta]|uniref:Uncharacterized protein n=1 Tax=Seminavis robusta TaxID=568900 RepID=A0A9N8EAQ1_9STRA|nr:expressed unknown protein [Seminavis robusta]|eukprot:Sro893_g217070.1 n/a (1237) ;mRNA; r:34260-37970